jgi:phage gpG-like protein
MIIKIDIDVQEAIDIMDAVDAVILSDNLADAAGAFAVNRIVSRTLSGKDIHGDPFTPYSGSYWKSGSNVNLYDTGEMLGSIDYSSSNESAFISCPSQTAPYHQQGLGNNPVREFMGLSLNDEADMVQKIFFDVIDSLTG